MNKGKNTRLGVKRPGVNPGLYALAMWPYTMTIPEPAPLKDGLEKSGDRNREPVTEPAPQMFMEASQGFHQH